MEVTQLRTKAVDGWQRYLKKVKKHHISSSHANVRRATSSKFCMVLEVVRAIISPCKLFWVPSIVSPLGVVENLAENAQSKLIVNNFVNYRNKATKFGTIIDTEDAHIRCKYCKNRARDSPIRGNYIGKIPFFFVFGAVNRHPWDDQGEISGRSAPTVRCTLLNFTLIGVTCRPCGAKNPKTGTWVKQYRQSCLRQILPIKTSWLTPLTFRDPCHTHLPIPVLLQQDSRPRSVMHQQQIEHVLTHNSPILCQSQRFTNFLLSGVCELMLLYR